MKKLILALLFISSQAIGALLPPIPTLNIGGQTFIAPLATNAKTLIGLIGASGANGNTSVRSAGASSGYQVPGGKSFRLQAIRCVTNGTTGAIVDFGYTDNDVGVETNNALTNFVKYNAGGSTSLIISTTAYESAFPLGSGMLIPTGKFITMSNGSSEASLCWLFGDEE